MVKTPSTMLPLGTPAPDFTYNDVVSGDPVSLGDFSGKKGLLVMFICRHCPFVKHIELQLADLGNAYQEQGVGVVAVSSNDAEKYPDDAPASLSEQAQQCGFGFPYLYDADQAMAKAYSAACTPDFFLFDGDMKLAYRGQLDASRPGNDIPVTGADLRGALDRLLAGEPAPEEQLPSVGCNIKWIPGQEPDYFTA